MNYLCILSSHKPWKNKHVYVLVADTREIDIGPAHLQPKTDVKAAYVLRC